MASSRPAMRSQETFEKSVPLGYQRRTRRLAFDEHEQAAVAVEAGDNGVHFPMSELGAVVEVGSLFDGEIAGPLEAAVGFGMLLVVGGGLVGELGGGDADVAVVDVVGSGHGGFLSGVVVDEGPG